MRQPNSTRRSNGYWRNFANVSAAVIEVMQKVGHFPRQSELIANGYSSLSCAIPSYYGGIESVRERMKIPIVFRKSKKMLEMEKQIGEPIEVYLKREYGNSRRSTIVIGEELG